jgi:Glyoxalase-like domain
LKPPASRGKLASGNHKGVHVRYVAALLMPLILICGCEKKKAQITSVKIEPEKPGGPRKLRKPSRSHPDGKRYPEQIKNRDPKTLLGGERGLDHVGVAVKDLAGAQRAYQKLGFGKPQPGELPQGLRNVAFQFGDTTHLELVTVRDAKKNPWVASFIHKHEQGALFLMLCAFSYGETANLLRRRGFKVDEARPGRIKTRGGRDGHYSGDTKPPMWHTFAISGTALPGNISFITYNRGLRNFVLFKVKDAKVRKKHFSHPNTALGLRSAWIAVKSLARAKKAFEKVGLSAGRALTLAQLGSRAQVIEAGEGTLLLMQPDQGKGPVAAFLKRRGEGILGLSFEVEHLDRARSLVESNLAVKLEPYDGAHGRSVLVPAERAAGVWVELFQGR